MAGRAPVLQSFVPNELQRKASTLEALAHYAECSCSRGRAPTPTLTGARPHLLRLLRPPALALLRRRGATRRASEAVAVVAPVTVQEWQHQKLSPSWLTSVNANLGQYTEAFASYTATRTPLLLDAEEDDFVEAFDARGQETASQKRILLGFRMLKA